MEAGVSHDAGPVCVTVQEDTAVARGYTRVFVRDGETYTVTRMARNRWELRRTQEGWRVNRRLNLEIDGSEPARTILGGLFQLKELLSLP
jgi:hypothetical protein